MQRGEERLHENDTIAKPRTQPRRNKQCPKFESCRRVALVYGSAQACERQPRNLLRITEREGVEHTCQAATPSHVTHNEASRRASNYHHTGVAYAAENSTSWPSTKNRHETARSSRMPPSVPSPDTEARTITARSPPRSGSRSNERQAKCGSMGRRFVMMVSACHAYQFRCMSSPPRSRSPCSPAAASLC